MKHPQAACIQFNSKAAPWWALAFPLLAAIGLPLRGIAATSAELGPRYADLQGEVLLDNARVLVQKFMSSPGSRRAAACARPINCWFSSRAAS